MIGTLARRDPRKARSPPVAHRVVTGGFFSLTTQPRPAFAGNTAASRPPLQRGLTAAFPHLRRRPLATRGAVERHLRTSDLTCLQVTTHKPRRCTRATTSPAHPQTRPPLPKQGAVPAQSGRDALVWRAAASRLGMPLRG